MSSCPIYISPLFPQGDSSRKTLPRVFSNVIDCFINYQKQTESKNGQDLKMVIRKLKEGWGYHATKERTEFDVVVTGIIKERTGRGINDVTLRIKEGEETREEHLRSRFHPVEIVEGLSMMIAMNQKKSGRGARLVINNNGYELEFKNYED